MSEARYSHLFPKIKELSNSKLTQTEIATELNISKTTLRKYQCLLNISRNFISARRLTETKINQIIFLHEEGHSIKDISINLKLGRTTIRKYIRSFGFITKLRKQYQINENFFDKIENEFQAYTLGFIAADGCIYSRNKILNIAVQKRDKNILQKIKDSIESSHPITLTKRGLVLLSISNVVMYNDLLNLGITPRKSSTLTPQIVPKHLQRDYWRGCFDGDGSLFKTSRGQYGLCFTGTLEMCKGFKNFIELNKPTIYKDERSPNNCQIRTSGTAKHVVIYAKKLYHQSKIYLDRKYDKYLEILNQSGHDENGIPYQLQLF